MHLISSINFGAHCSCTGFWYGFSKTSHTPRSVNIGLFFFFCFFLSAYLYCDAVEKNVAITGHFSRFIYLDPKRIFFYKEVSTVITNSHSYKKRQLGLISWACSSLEPLNMCRQTPAFFPWSHIYLCLFPAP